MKLPVKQVMLSVMALFCISISTAYAVEIEVQGEGQANISENFIEVQTIAKKDAVRHAVAMAVRKVIGSEAMDNPKIQQKFDDIVSQFNVYKVKQSETSHKEGSQYITNIVVILDDVKFRQTISDMGAAINTTTVRSSAILTLIRVFYNPQRLTNPAPLSEVTVYKYDHDTSSSEKDTLAAKSSSDKSSAKSSSDIGSVNVKASSAGSLSAKNNESSSYDGSSKAKIAGSNGSASASDNASAKYSQKGSVDSRHDDRITVDAKNDKRSASSSASTKKVFS